MKAMKTTVAATLFTAALSLGSFAAHAQPGQGAPSEPGQGAPAQPHAAQPQAAQQAPQIDAKQLDKFVVAFADVRQLEQQFTRQLESIESEEEARSLQQKTQQEMITAVEESGLEVDQYNQIVSAMRQDPQLRDKILSQVE